jgi:hypothetical protein
MNNPKHNYTTKMRAAFGLCSAAVWAKCIMHVRGASRFEESFSR